MLAACAAPAIVKAEILMPVRTSLQGRTRLRGRTSCTIAIDECGWFQGELGVIEDFRIISNESYLTGGPALWKGLRPLSISPVLVPRAFFIPSSYYEDLKMPYSGVET